MLREKVHIVSGNDSAANLASSKKYGWTNQQQHPHKRESGYIRQYLCSLFRKNAIIFVSIVIALHLSLILWHISGDISSPNDPAWGFNISRSTQDVIRHINDHDTLNSSSPIEEESLVLRVIESNLTREIIENAKVRSSESLASSKFIKSNNTPTATVSVKFNEQQRSSWKRPHSFRDHHAFARQWAKGKSKNSKIATAPAAPMKIFIPLERKNKSIDNSTAKEWEDFVAEYHHLQYRPSSGVLRIISASTALSSMIRCNAAVEQKLSSPALPKRNFSWCAWALSPEGGNVQVGKSWGSLQKNKVLKDKYEMLNCNVVAEGKNPSCDDEWGDLFVTQWTNSRPKDHRSGDALHTRFTCSESSTSKVSCYEGSSKERFCVLENALIDFRKYEDVYRGPNSTMTRRFEKGFISTDCKADNGRNDVFPLDYLYSSHLNTSTAYCDAVINGTVLMFTHDIIENFGHTMNDYMNVWLMMWLANSARSMPATSFLNIDALKFGHNHLDKIGPFHTVYLKNFLRVLRADDFQGNRVCVERLLVPPIPPKFFVWNNWFKDSPCSFMGPSSLHQRWNLHTRSGFNLLDKSTPEGQLAVSSAWAAVGSDWSLIEKKIKILFIVRNVHTNQFTGCDRTCRNILEFDMFKQNMYEEIRKWNSNSDALKKSSNLEVEIAFVDLATLNMTDQITLAASSNLIAGTHGAGIAMSQFMPIGSENCCGVLEIYPFSDFTPIRGHGNMVRRMGVHYNRIDLDDAHSFCKGVNITASEVWLKLAALIEVMRVQPTCVLPAVIDDPYLEHNRE